MLAAISNPAIATSVRMLKIESIYRGREAVGVSVDVGAFHWLVGEACILVLREAWGL